MGYRGVRRLFVQQSCSIHVPSTLDIYITQEHNRRRLHTCLNIDAAVLALNIFHSLKFIVPIMRLGQSVTTTMLSHTSVDLVSCAPLTDGFIPSDSALFVPSPYTYTHGCEIQQQGSALPVYVNTRSLRPQ